MAPNCGNKTQFVKSFDFETAILKCLKKLQCSLRLHKILHTDGMKGGVGLMYGTPLFSTFKSTRGLFLVP